MVIKALGFDPEDLPSQFNQRALAVNRWGAVKVDYRTMMTSMDGVFAAGDIASIEGRPLEKSGVFAVRMGKPLARNLRLSLAGAPLVCGRCCRSPCARGACTTGRRG